jgi:hypothetical protein
MNTFHCRSLLRANRRPSIPKRTLFKSRTNKLFVPNIHVNISHSLVMNRSEAKIQDTTFPIERKPWQSTERREIIPDDKADCRSVRSNYSHMSCRSKKSKKSRIDTQPLNESAVYFDSEGENNKYK